MAWLMRRLTKRTTGASSETWVKLLEALALVGLVEVGAEGGELSLGPVVLVDAVVDLGATGELEDDASSDETRDVVLQVQVAERAQRDRDDDLVTAQGVGQRRRATGEVPREQGHGGRVDRFVGEVDEVEAHGLGRELQQQRLVDETTLDERLEHRLVGRGPRRGERDVLGRDDPGAQQRLDRVADGPQHDASAPGADPLSALPEVSAPSGADLRAGQPESAAIRAAAPGGQRRRRSSALAGCSR